jgi:hypothetical protein
LFKAAADAAQIAALWICGRDLATALLSSKAA